MSKGYTKQEVQKWKNWSKSREESAIKDPPMVAWAKSKEESARLVKEGIRSYEYELSLRSEDDQFIVDCREDVMEDEETISSEYEEGFIFDNYSEAEKKLKEIEDRLEKQNKKIFITNEVKTLHNVTGREIETKEEEPTLWTVDLNTVFKNILFDCTEDELEQNVQEFVISELENLDWTYEKADVNVSKTMIRS
tara:strand:+ start:807 stop:1388 length:582 start_codon:yes stop_codon:yes gene_type:complete